MRNSHDKDAQHDRDIQRNQAEIPTSKTLNMTEKSSETNAKVQHKDAGHDRYIQRSQCEKPTTKTLNMTNKPSEANEKAPRHKTILNMTEKFRDGIEQSHDKHAQHDPENQRNQCERPTTTTLNMR